MFETAVLSYGPPTKRVWATFAGFTGQVALIGCALLAPLLWPQVIPKVAWSIPIVGPPPPPPPPLPTGAVVPVHHAKSYSQFIDNVLTAPVKVPDRAVQLTDDEPVVATRGGGVVGGVDGGQKGGVQGAFLLTDILNQGRPLPKAPAAEVKEPPKTPPPVVVTKAPPRISQMTPATPIHRVEPPYPPLAKAAGISGRVELLGVLGTDGRIHELKVVSGHPLLIQAALEAVKQWTFAPTILNGQAVEVQAPIQVNFILHR